MLLPNKIFITQIAASYAFVHFLTNTGKFLFLLFKVTYIQKEVIGKVSLDLDFNHYKLKI